MNRDAKQKNKYMFPFLLTVVIAVGFYFFSTTDYDFFGAKPPSFALKFYCDKALLKQNGVDADDMQAVEEMLAQYAKQVRKADMFVDKARKKSEVLATSQPEANFYVNLELVNGCLLKSRPTRVDWAGLEKAMAGAVDRCMKEYHKLSANGAKKLDGTVIMNL